MSRASTEERLLVLVLRFAGAVLLLAYAAVFLPVAWMAAVHRWLGLGEFPTYPIVDYLTRSISILYGIKGGLYLLLSTDVRRFRPVIVYSGWAAIGFGLAMFVIDLRAGMPWTWTLGEGPCIILAGAALLVLVRRVNGDIPDFDRSGRNQECPHLPYNRRMDDSKNQPASRLITTLGAVLGQVAKPSSVLKTILTQSVAQTGAERGVFVEVSRSGKLSYRVLYRFQQEDLTGDAGRYSSTIFANVMSGGRTVRLSNALDDPRFAESGSIHDFSLVSVLCAPIRVDGKIAALVHLEHNQADHFTAHHQELVESLLDLSGPILAALYAGQGVIEQNDELKQSEHRAREELELDRDQLAKDWSFGRFVGRSAAVRALGRSVGRAAKSDFPILLIGETGTGKSILARVLHHQSKRAKNAMVTVFCPSLEKGLVEAELFGHKRGAFTGAVADRVGKVQAAANGTIFLDEIGELPLEIQPKLLRLLQEKTFERVGDPKEQQANVRVIAATNRDLRREVQQGRFRRDLYERLNYVPIRVPPLRERRYDIPVLLRHCLDQHDEGRWIEITPDAEHYLMELDFTWPGNVRHVEQLAARLSLFSPEEPVTPDDLEQLLETDSLDSEVEGSSTPPTESEFEDGLPAFLARAERQWLEEALRRYADVPKKDLARKLNIGESTLHKKIKLYRIDG